MCHQNVVFCPCTTCLADRANAYVGIYYDLCDETSTMTRSKAAIYGEDRVDLAGEAEYHTQTREFSRGRAWKEETDASLPEDRWWECEKSGFKFVEDEGAKRTVINADVPISEDLP